MVHVNLIGPYSKSIRQHHPGSYNINNNVSLTCMTILGLATGCSDIVEVPKYDLGEVNGGNNEYIDKFILWGKPVVQQDMAKQITASTQSLV